MLMVISGHMDYLEKHYGDSKTTVRELKKAKRNQVGVVYTS
jgi:hypothetical protein